MPIQPDGTAPYTPTATILSVIEHARERSMPPLVTKDVLVRIGVADSLAARTLQALQLLELINEDGTWTQNLETLRRAPENEFQQRLAELLRSVYADVFQYVDPTKDNSTRIRDQFRNYTPHGQQERMVTLFLGLCQRAGLVSEESPVKTIAREPRAVRKTNITNGSVKPKAKTVVAQNVGGAGLPPPLAGLLATLPQSGWTQDERERFKTAFSAMLDYCIPIRTESALEEDPE